MRRVKRKQNIGRRNIAKQRYKKLAKMRKRKRFFGNQYLWLGVLIFIVLIGLGVWAIFGPVFQIKEIKISGNQEVSGDDVLTLVRNQIDKKILFWATKSIFLASSQKITENILAEFPKVEKASLKRKLPGVLLIKIKEREPVAVYCSGEDCFFIDKTGIVFKEAVEYENYLVISAASPPAGGLIAGVKILEDEQLDIILKIKQEVQNNLKIPLKETVISDDKLTIRTAEGWEIYFNTAENINWQLTELKAVLEKQIPLENREDLEYIDLRFSRVYYKYR